MFLKTDCKSHIILLIQEFASKQLFVNLIDSIEIHIIYIYHLTPPLIISDDEILNINFLIFVIYISFHDTYISFKLNVVALFDFLNIRYKITEYQNEKKQIIVMPFFGY